MTYTIGLTAVSQERFSEFIHSFSELLPTRASEIQRAAQDNTFSHQEIASFLDFDHNRRWTTNDMVQNPAFRTLNSFFSLNNFLICYPETELNYDEIFRRYPVANAPVGSPLWNNPAYVWTQITNDYRQFGKASAEIQNNPQFAAYYSSKAFAHSRTELIHRFSYLPDAVRSDENIVRMFASSAPEILSCVGTELSHRDSFWIRLLEQDPTYIIYVPRAVLSSILLCENDFSEFGYRFIEQILDKDPSYLLDLPPEISARPELISQFLYIPKVIAFIDPMLQSDRSFILSQAKKNITILFYLPSRELAQSIWEELFDQMPNSFGLEYLPYRNLSYVQQRLAELNIQFPERLHYIHTLLSFLQMQINFRRQIYSSAPIDLVVANQSDHNHAFSFSHWLDQLILSGHQVFYQEVRNVEEVNSLALYLNQQNWVQDTTILAGHSNPIDGLFLYDRDDRVAQPNEIIGPQNTHDDWFDIIVRRTRRQVLAWGCSLGISLVKPFAHAAPLPTIIGPDRSTNINDIWFDLQGNLQVAWYDGAQTIATRGSKDNR